ncbi:MAG: hypothetical protein Q4G68_03500 [Planctomycetia bacterium]|nr:hypothetical protein [Planctomycetia bacterium]
MKDRYSDMFEDHSYEEPADDQPVYDDSGRELRGKQRKKWLRKMRREQRSQYGEEDYDSDQYEGNDSTDSQGGSDYANESVNYSDYADDARQRANASEEDYEEEASGEYDDADEEEADPDEAGSSSSVHDQRREEIEEEDEQDIPADAFQEEYPAVPLPGEAKAAKKSKKMKKQRSWKVNFAPVTNGLRKAGRWFKSPFVWMKRELAGGGDGVEEAVQNEFQSVVANVAADPVKQAGQTEPLASDSEKPGKSDSDAGATATGGKGKLPAFLAKNRNWRRIAKHTAITAAAVSAVLATGYTVTLLVSHGNRDEQESVENGASSKEATEIFQVADEAATDSKNAGSEPKKLLDRSQRNVEEMKESLPPKLAEVRKEADATLTKLKDAATELKDTLVTGLEKPDFPDPESNATDTPRPETAQFGNPDPMSDKEADWAPDLNFARQELPESTEPIKDLASDAHEKVDSALETVTDSADEVKTNLNAALDNLADKATSAQNQVDSALTTTRDSIANTATELQEKVESGLNTLTDKATEIQQNITGEIDSTVDSLKQGASDLADLAPRTMSVAPDHVSATFGEPEQGVTLSLTPRKDDVESSPVPAASPVPTGLAAAPLASTPAPSSAPAPAPATTLPLANTATSVPAAASPDPPSSALSLGSLAPVVENGAASTAAPAPAFPSVATPVPAPASPLSLAAAPQQSTPELVPAAPVATGTTATPTPAATLSLSAAVPNAPSTGSTAASPFPGATYPNKGTLAAAPVPVAPVATAPVTPGTPVSGITLPQGPLTSSANDPHTQAAATFAPMTGSTNAWSSTTTANVATGTPATLPPMTGASNGPVTAALPGSVPATATAASTSAAAPNQRTRTYTTQEGDNLFTIAERELGNINRWQEIRQINNLSPGTSYFEPGTQLLLPW